MDAPERLRSLNAALALLEDDRHRRSERICRCLVKHNRDDIEALLLLGLAVGMQGRTAAAAVMLNRVARARPGFAHPCADLARMLLAHDSMSLVDPQYRACLELTPDDLRLCYAFAGFLRETGEAAEAVSVLAPVLRAHPDSAEAHDQMGLALAEAGRFAEATEQFRQSIALDPAQATFWANLGMMLKVEGQFDAALDAYDAALARAPGNRQIRVNRAVARLHAGRFAEAWQDEDWVLAEPGRSILPAEQLLPPLSRLPDLTGRTVLVVQEEGLGDTLQFLRYLPLLAQRGARVVVVVPPTLTRLMRTVPGVDRSAGRRRTGAARTTSIARSTACRAPSRPRWRPFPCDVPYLDGRSGAGAPLGRAAAGRRCVAGRAVLGRTGAAVADGVCRTRSPAKHQPGDPGAARRGARGAVRQPAEGTGGGRSACGGLRSARCDG